MENPLYSCNRRFFGNYKDLSHFYPVSQILSLFSLFLFHTHTLTHTQTYYDTHKHTYTNNFLFFIFKERTHTHTHTHSVRSWLRFIRSWMLRWSSNFLSVWQAKVTRWTTCDQWYIWSLLLKQIALLINSEATFNNLKLKIGGYKKDIC